jgi:CDP-paratose synthetase
MNIAVTGDKGALGQEIIQSLINDGHTVHCIRRRGGSLKNKTMEGQLLHGNSNSELRELFSNYSIQAVIHLSTNYGYLESASEVLMDNLFFPIELLNIASEFKVPLFLNTDTFFNKNDYSYRKLRNYALSKRAFLLWLENTKTTKIVTLRLEHTYGPNDRPEKFLTKAINEIAINKVKYFNATSGLHKRDFLDVRDASSAYLTVLYNQQKISKDCYEIGSGKATSIKECLMLIKSLSQSPTEILFGTVPLIPEDNYDSNSSDEFNKDFNWESKIDLSEGFLYYIKKLGNI